MSSDKPPRQLPNTALGAGATCLGVLQTWADLPGLGTAASSALFILTYITEFKATQDDWKRFGNRIFQEIKLIQERAHPELQAMPDMYFQGDISILTEELIKIQHTIQKQKASSRLKRFFRLGGDAELLRRLENDFTHATMHFSRATFIQIRHQLGKMANTVEDSSSSELLNELPPKPTCFHGQEMYTETVTNEIITGYESGSHSRISIHGTPGLGKTTIARIILHHPRVESIFGVHRYFISCEACLTPTLLLLAMARELCLRVDGKSQAHENLLSRVMSFLRSVKKPVLLILDNFETVWNFERKSQVQDLLDRLAALHNTTLMVTMRSSNGPDGSLWAKLPRLRTLDASSARQAFNEMAGIDEDPLADSQQLDRLLCKVGYLPQAVVLLAGLIRSGDTIASLHERWPTEGTAIISTDTGDHHYNLDASFRLSIFSPPMIKEPFALRLLSTIARLPNGIAREYLENVTSIPKEKIHHAAYTLRSVGLAEYEGDIFKSIPALRQYMAREHPPPNEDVIKTRAYCRRLVVPKGPDAIPTFEQISPVLGNIYETLFRWIDSGNDIEKAASTVLKLSNILFNTTDSTDVLDYLIDRQLTKVSPAMRAALLQMQGMLFASSENYHVALESLNRAIPIHKKLQNTMGVSKCLWQIGDIFRLQGWYKAALVPLKEALDGYHTDKLISIEGRASCLWSLADTLHILGDSSSALASVQEARDLYRSMNSELAVTCVTLLWISIEISRDNFFKAQEMLDTIRDAKGGDQSIYKNYLLEEGKLLFHAGKLDQAKDSLQHCLSLCISKHRDSRQVRGDALRYLGIVSLREKDVDNAKQYFTAAQEIYGFLGNNLHIAEVKTCFALLHLLKGEKPAAKGVFINARDLFDGLGCKRGLATCLVSIAKLDAKEGNLTDAVAQLKRAESLYNDIGNTSQVSVCRQMLELLGD